MSMVGVDSCGCEQLPRILVSQPDCLSAAIHSGAGHNRTRDTHRRGTFYNRGTILVETVVGEICTDVDNLMQDQPGSLIR